MKCIVFVSEAPITSSGVRLPIGLSNIVKAWNRNKTADVTGFLCYRNGHYIEVIEGPTEKINQLATRVVNDPRHTNFQILIDKQITKRSFTDSQVNIIDFVAQGDLFKQLIRDYRFEIVHLTTAQKQRIEHFCDVDAIIDSDNNSTSTSHNYDGKNLRLLSWPDFNLISQSQTNIDLCVKLTKQPYSFNQLMADNGTDTQEQIIATLNKFQELGILTVTEPAPLMGQPKAAPQTKTTSNFYHAIKKFLGMR